MQKRTSRLARCGTVAVAGLLCSTTPSVSSADFFINENAVVVGSTCSGFDCVNNELFGLENMLLKQNNNRIRFDDTSGAVGFPNTDWQITANDDAAGGLNRFSIDDLTASRKPFSIIAGAPSNAIFVNSLGDVGFGTATPAVELHVMDNNTPHLRLEQDGTGGFSPRAWDIGANESYLFIRDFTSDTFPFRILAGAPDKSLHIASTGNIGIGTDAPTAKLHAVTNTNTNHFIVSENTNTGTAATAVLRAQSDTATVNFQAHGSGRTLIRFGQPLGGWAEFLQVTGNGLMIGTVSDRPHHSREKQHGAAAHRHGRCQCDRDTAGQRNAGGGP
jgi:hypothetical protein